MASIKSELAKVSAVLENEKVNKAFSLCFQRINMVFRVSNKRYTIESERRRITNELVGRLPYHQYASVYHDFGTILKGVSSSFEWYKNHKIPMNIDDVELIQLSFGIIVIRRLKDRLT